MLGAAGTQDVAGPSSVWWSWWLGTVLTQHALGVPGIFVPGLDPVLHGPRDLVEIHVLHCAVHAAAVVGLSGGGGPHHVSHLGAKGGESRVRVEPLNGLWGHMSWAPIFHTQRRCW